MKVELGHLIFHRLSLSCWADVLSNVDGMLHLYPKYALVAHCPAQVQTTRKTVYGTMQSVITVHVA
jgi:hypothetical protein